MKKLLSPRQKQIYDFIAEYITGNGFPPSFEDIAEGMNLSSSTIVAHVNLMKKKGALSSREGTSRSFRLHPENAG
jgi:repressor LexA